MVLLIGWANYVKIAAVRTKDPRGQGWKGAGSKYVEIVAVFDTEYYISGLAPYGDSLVVLAYIPDIPDGPVEAAAAEIAYATNQVPESRSRCAIDSGRTGLVTSMPFT